MASITEAAKSAPSLPVLPLVPMMSREAFAAAIGLPVGVIVGFCNKGYLPTVSVGKYSLINVALLQQRCLEQGFSL
ncbi:hypothetical protein [Burkholderia thailandensis]|uniref:hypothetical protein n=1 Tax=Burkholderia thailandensis TaxID=57975 RepID=UPI00075332DC|nr:hypothetical protein [Burkholderia thailandensis]KVG12117.1 hypothetical protein WJ25_07945 [Burkholderia thailandensis]